MCNDRFLLTERNLARFREIYNTNRNLSLFSPPVIGPSTRKKNTSSIISPLLACIETNLSFFYDVLKLIKQVNSKSILISIAQGLWGLICKPAQPWRQRQLKNALKVNTVFPPRIEGLKFCRNSHDMCNVRGSHSVAETQVGFILINLYISTSSI